MPFISTPSTSPPSGSSGSGSSSPPNSALPLTAPPPPPAYNLPQDPPSYDTVLSRTLSRPYYTAGTPINNNASTSNVGSNTAGNNDEKAKSGEKPGMMKRRSSILSTFSSNSNSRRTPSTTPIPEQEDPVVDPSTLLPPTFRIGTDYITPVITIKGMKEHLRLLAALSKRREEVEGSASGLVERRRGAGLGFGAGAGASAGASGFKDEKAGFNKDAPGKPHQPQSQAKDQDDETPHSDSEEEEDEDDLDPPLTPDVAYQAYLSLSEQRFYAWLRSPSVKKLRGRHFAWKREDLPRDLGVVGVWHGYCLNPRTYWDDTREREEGLGVLNRANAFPLRLISECINPETLEYCPVPGQDPIPTPTAEDLLQATVDVACPWCSTATPARLLTDPIVQDGLCQKYFAIKCTGCKEELDHEILKVGKFLKDIRNVVTGKLQYLPGMHLRPSTGIEDDERPKLFSQLIAKVFIKEFDREMKLYPVRKEGPWTAGRSPVRPERDAVITSFGAFNKNVQPYHTWELEHEDRNFPGMFPPIKRIMEDQPVGPNDLYPPREMKFYHDKLNQALDDGRFKTWVAGFRLIGDELPRRMGKMWSAYQNTGMASLNLAEACERQAGFIAKMKGMGWLETGRFEGEGKAFLLQRSAARYHAFLDLMATVPAGFLCPTLDIDLGWHTHQLNTLDYHEQTIKHIGRFVDHDDKVSENRLSDAYAYTAKQWLKRFGVPYSACGCHQGDGLMNVLNPAFAIPGKLKFWNKNKETPEDRRKRVVLQMDGEMAEEERESTHPSTHNLIRVNGLFTEDEARILRHTKDAERDRAVPNNTIKDPEKARLDALFRKKPAHQNPFLYTAGYDSVLQPYSVLEKDRQRAQAGDVAGMGRAGYWGVGLGAGVVIGGGVVWGMSSPDCHNEDADNLRGNAGACAVGVGATAGGYCGTASGSCAAAACAGAGGGAGCSAGAGACGGGGGGGGGGGCGGGGGGGGCGGGGGGC